MLADLYIMKAEPIVQYYDSPTQEAYDAINKVRERAGLPKVEVVWGNPQLARTINKHRTKEGLLEIILRERDNELAFEGSRYWDVLRYKKALSEFSKANVGWNNMGSDAESFFVRTVYQQNRFFKKNYLWPIRLRELTINENLIQNPGW